MNRDQWEMTGQFDAVSVKPVRAGRYPYAMFVDGTYHEMPRQFDGERWLNHNGTKPFAVSDGDKWRGLTHAQHLALR